MKSALYGAIKSEAQRRDRVYKTFAEADHPDALKLFELHNGVVNDLVRDYKAAGGRRPVSQFVREVP